MEKERKLNQDWIMEPELDLDADQAPEGEFVDQDLFTMEDYPRCNLDDVCNLSLTMTSLIKETSIVCNRDKIFYKVLERYQLKYLLFLNQLKHYFEIEIVKCLSIKVQC